MVLADTMLLSGVDMWTRTSRWLIAATNRFDDPLVCDNESDKSYNIIVVD